MENNPITANAARVLDALAVIEGALESVEGSLAARAALAGSHARHALDYALDTLALAALDAPHAADARLAAARAALDAAREN